MTQSGESASAELRRIRAEREALEAKVPELRSEERRIRREVHGDALLRMLEAVDPLPILRELGLRDGASQSEVQGLVSMIVQDVSDALVQKVCRR